MINNNASIDQVTVWEWSDETMPNDPDERITITVADLKRWLFTQAQEYGYGTITPDGEFQPFPDREYETADWMRHILSPEGIEAEHQYDTLMRAIHALEIQAREAGYEDGKRSAQEPDLN